MIEQSENIFSRLNEKLLIIADHPSVKVTITYFVPDEKKSGGTYVSYTGTVRKIDDYDRKLIMADKTIIPIDGISKMDSPIFDEMGIEE